MHTLNQISATPGGKAVADQLIHLIQHPDQIESFMQSTSMKEDLWNNPHIYHLIGYIYFYQNRPDKAMEMFDQALLLDPGDTYALEFKGLCQEDLDMPPDTSAIAPARRSDLKLEDLELCDDIEGLMDHLTEITYQPETPPAVSAVLVPSKASQAPYIPSQTAERIADLLDCPCTFYPPSADPETLKNAYFSALKRSRNIQFTPVMIKSDPAFLARMNACAEHIPLPGSAVRTDQWKIPDGAQYLEDMIAAARERWEDSGKDTDALSGLAADGEAVKSFSCYWNYDNGLTDEMILAEIPCSRPWELFAWLPDQICSGMPDTPYMISIAKYWYLLYGAIPATISHDVLEFYVETPVYPESAYGLAWEQYGFCPALLKEDGNGQTIGWLADSLTHSTVWRFQWTF